MELASLPSSKLLAVLHLCHSLISSLFQLDWVLMGPGVDIASILQPDS